eukprot:5402451-Pyramimonas_sp.AAC.1
MQMLATHPGPERAPCGTTGPFVCRAPEGRLSSLGTSIQTSASRSVVPLVALRPREASLQLRS